MPPSPRVRVDTLASPRLSYWGDLVESTCLSGTLSVELSSRVQDWGRGFKRDWIRGMSKLFTLYTLAIETPLEREIGAVATFVTSPLSGLPDSHHYPEGNSDIYSPFEIELFTRFDDNAISRLGEISYCFRDSQPVAPVVQLVTSKPSDVGT